MPHEEYHRPGSVEEATALLECARGPAHRRGDRPHGAGPRRPERPLRPGRSQLRAVSRRTGRRAGRRPAHRGDRAPGAAGERSRGAWPTRCSGRRPPPWAPSRSATGPRWQATCATGPRPPTPLRPCSATRRWSTSWAPPARREVPLEEFWKGPGQTVLRPGEWVEAVGLPPPPPHGGCYLKLGRTLGVDLAVTGVAALVSDAGVRLAAASVAPTPRRLRPVEAVLSAAAAGVPAGHRPGHGRGDRSHRRRPRHCRLPAGDDRRPGPPGLGGGAGPLRRAGEEPPMTAGSIRCVVTVNGTRHDLRVGPRQTLLQLLREDLGLLGTRSNCEQGECGACTVLLDGEAVNSCLVPAAGVDGHAVTTIEGLGSDGRLDPVQQAFLEAEASQCGFCTPGLVMAARALLDHNPHPGPEEIRAGLAGNYCRCTGYTAVLEAVAAAAAAPATGSRRLDPAAHHRGDALPRRPGGPGHAARGVPAAALRPGPDPRGGPRPGAGLPRRGPGVHRGRLPRRHPPVRPHRGRPADTGRRPGPLPGRAGGSGGGRVRRRGAGRRRRGAGGLRRTAADLHAGRGDGLAPAPRPLGPAAGAGPLGRLQRHGRLGLLVGLPRRG